VGVEHVHDAELVDARPDEREVANCEGTDLEVVGDEYCFEHGAAGDAHALALKTDGSVVAWGNNVSDQISVPTDLVNDNVAVAALLRAVLGLPEDAAADGKLADVKAALRR
jgi:alpha-tubulin suppressor-like RCC1 family protein